MLEINTNSDGIKVQKHGDNKIRCICSVNDDNGKCSIVNNSDNNDEGDDINRNNNKVNNMTEMEMLTRISMIHSFVWLFKRWGIFSV